MKNIYFSRPFLKSVFFILFLLLVYLLILNFFLPQPPFHFVNSHESIGREVYINPNIIFFGFLKLALFALFFFFGFYFVGRQTKGK